MLPLGTTPAGLAVPHDHRFARRRRPVTLADLSGERVLIWSQRSTGTSRLQELLAGVDVEWTVSTVVGRDGLADVARGAAVAVWPSTTSPIATSSSSRSTRRSSSRSWPCCATARRR